MTKKKSLLIDSKHAFDSQSLVFIGLRGMEKEKREQNRTEPLKGSAAALSFVLVPRNSVHRKREPLSCLRTPPPFIMLPPLLDADSSVDRKQIRTSPALSHQPSRAVVWTGTVLLAKFPMSPMCSSTPFKPSQHIHLLSGLMQAQLLIGDGL